MSTWFSSNPVDVEPASTVPDAHQCPSAVIHDLYWLMVILVTVVTVHVLFSNVMKCCLFRQTAANDATTKAIVMTALQNSDAIAQVVRGVVLAQRQQQQQRSIRYDPDDSENEENDNRHFDDDESQPGASIEELDDNGETIKGSFMPATTTSRGATHTKQGPYGSGTSENVRPRPMDSGEQLSMTVGRPYQETAMTQYCARSEFGSPTTTSTAAPIKVVQEPDGAFIFMCAVWLFLAAVAILWFYFDFVAELLPTRRMTTWEQLCQYLRGRVGEWVVTNVLESPKFGPVFALVLTFVLKPLYIVSLYGVTKPAYLYLRSRCCHRVAPRPFDPFPKVLFDVRKQQ